MNEARIAATRREVEARAVAPWRKRRVLAASWVSVVLALVGHLAGSGVVPGVLPVAACLLGIAWIARKLVWREWTATEIMLLLLAASGLCHVVFALAQATPLAGGVPRGLFMGVSIGHAPVGSALSMLVAHCAASALSAWVLRRGEAAAWRLARAAARLRARLTGALGARSVRWRTAAPSPLLRIASPIAHVRHRRLACASSRRGPPRRVPAR